jgi:hypothetical protein
MFGKLPRLALLAPAILALLGCATRYAEVAHSARTSVIGYTQDDILMCAGHPTNVDKAHDGEIWMYEHGSVTPGAATPTIISPYGGASISQNSGQYCRVQFRFVNGRVSEISYAGDTDIWGARDAECGPIVRNCLEYKAPH